MARAHPSQAQLLHPLPVTVILLLGITGVALASRAGLPSAPEVRNAEAWRRILFTSGGAGILFGAALLTSLIEPASQLALARPGMAAALTGLFILTFAANLFEAQEFRRHGWLAPILFGLAFYSVWHCFGPYLMSEQSILYPGPN